VNVLFRNLLSITCACLLWTIASCSSSTVDVDTQGPNDNGLALPPDNSVEETNTSAEPATFTTQSDAPNILLILSDDQGVDASAQYSLTGDIPNTPTLNSLAESGLVFDNAWATPACTTTRGSIITGKHGVNSGIDRVPDLMPTGTNTLQRALSNANAGVDTAVIGKWHLTGGSTNLTSHPTDSGVGYYAGNIAGTINDYENWPLTQNGITSTSTTYHATAITDLAIFGLRTLALTHRFIYHRKIYIPNRYRPARQT